MARIAVSVHARELDIAAQWEALATRARANVFMHPVALNAVYATNFSRLRTLLAWDESARPRALVGVWALQERTVLPLWPPVLDTPAYDYAFVASPVIDPACMDEVVAAFLATIGTAPGLPRVVRLQSLEGETETFAAIQKALTMRGKSVLTLAEQSRPFVSRAVGLKRSGSTRKKLRQDWNRLAALGGVEIANERSRDGVQAAFETFLAMEAASWKGAQGTALLCRDRDAAFARRLIGDLAAAELASVALLRVSGRPIAAQVLLYCGTLAYTWKTAFDGQFARYSPGVLLIDRLTEMLLAGSVEAIESCSPEGSFMAQLWTGRRTAVDLLADLGAEPSLQFRIVALGEHAYARARAVRKRLRARSLWPDRKRRGVPIA